MASHVFQAITKWAKALLSSGLDFLFPQSDEGHYIATLTADDLAKHLHIQNVYETTVLFSYQDSIIRRMIWMLKYKQNRHVARLFGAILTDYLLDVLSDAYIFESQSKLLLVSMPLSFFRKLKRGFNQMEFLAETMTKHDKNLFTLEKKALKKIRETKPQTKLSRKERLTNVQNSLRANALHVRGKTIVLIDDVMTTGSTMKEARRALMRGGAKKVICIALAS